MNRCELMKDQKCILIQTAQQAHLKITFIKENEIPQKPSLAKVLEKTSLKESASKPEMALIFESQRRVLKLDGFPAYLKESVEMVECGQLDRFRPIEFMQAISRFGNTQQRWGV